MIFKKPYQAVTVHSSCSSNCPRDLWIKKNDFYEDGYLCPIQAVFCPICGFSLNEATDES